MVVSRGLEVSVPVCIVNESFGELLSRHGLDSFEALWSLPENWVEPINSRKGGWSGVVKMTLEGVTFYVKRQHHQRRRLRTFPWTLRPTYFHEYKALEHMAAQELPVVEWLLYAERGDDAVLVTRAAEGFVDLNELVAIGDRRLLTRAACRISETLSLMHRAGWQHGACYPAHLLVHPDTLDVRLIDLERSRQRLFRRVACRADLDQLRRRAPKLPPPILLLLTIAPPMFYSQSNQTEVFT